MALELSQLMIGPNVILLKLLFMCHIKVETPGKKLHESFQAGHNAIRS